jgi:peptidyl-prolyl cis-trans isomerase D
MLEFLRRGVKSWVAKVLLALLIASFAVWGISDVFSTRRDAAVARVGDATVTIEEFANALQRQRNALSRQRGEAVSYAQMREAGIDRMILARMMRDRAFEQELAAIGIAAPDPAVAEAIRSNTAFQGPGGGFSESNYRLTLQRLGFSPAEFEELTRTLLGQQILEDAATGAGAVPPGFAARIAAYQGERRGMATVTLPLSRADDPGNPSDEALQAHYEENAETWREPERRSGVYLHVDIAELAAEAEPTEAEIDAYYERNDHLYSREPARVIDQLPLPEGEADALAARVRDGETTFEELARELGEDPAGISLGRVSPDDLPEASSEAVFSVSEPGLIGPVELPTGAQVLIRVREVIEGGTEPLAEVRDEIVARLKRDAALDRAPEIANRIEDLRAEGLPLAEIAERTGLELHRFEGLAEDLSLPGGGTAEGFEGRVDFVDEVFAALDYEERDLVETPEGGYFLVLVEEIRESRVPGLSEVRGEVVEHWRRARRREALLEEAERLADRLSGPETLAGYAEEEGLTVTEHTPFPRDGAPAEMPFQLVSELFGAEEGEAAARALPGEAGVMLGEVTAIEPLEPDALERLAAQLEEVLSGQYREDDREFFARAIRDGYEASVDQEAIESAYGLLGAARQGG